MRDRYLDNFRYVVWVMGLNPRTKGRPNSVICFANQQKFVIGADFALPAVHRAYTWNNVYAGSQTFLHQTIGDGVGNIGIWNCNKGDSKWCHGRDPGTLYKTLISMAIDPFKEVVFNTS